MFSNKFWDKTDEMVIENLRLTPCLRGAKASVDYAEGPFLVQNLKLKRKISHIRSKTYYNAGKNEQFVSIAYN